jgi:hypothetical protein
VTTTAVATQTPVTMAAKPLYDLTVSLLGCVRDHDFTTLARLCDDDFGIVEITTTGGSLVIRDRAGWEDWFTGLFAQLAAAKASTWSEITGYEVRMGQDMAYSVVDFDQMFVTDQESLRFTVIATIIWKRVDGDWKESRYHSSLIAVTPV